MVMTKIDFFPEICQDFATLFTSPNSSYLVLLYNRVLTVVRERLTLVPQQTGQLRLDLER